MPASRLIPPLPSTPPLPSGVGALRTAPLHPLAGHASCPRQEGGKLDPHVQPCAVAATGGGVRGGGGGEGAHPLGWTLMYSHAILVLTAGTAQRRGRGEGRGGASRGGEGWGDSAHHGGSSLDPSAATVATADSSSPASGPRRLHHPICPLPQSVHSSCPLPPADAVLPLQAPGALILYADLDEYLATSSPMTAKQVSEVKGGSGGSGKVVVPRLSSAAA